MPEQQMEDQLEAFTENTLEEPNDDAPLQNLHQLRRHPLNINTADEEQLMQLPFLSPILIRNLLLYRNVMGKLIHINELQAVPGWEPSLIRKLLPYITIAENDFTFAHLSERFKHLHSLILLRIGQSLGSAEQRADSGSTAFVGSAQQVLIRLQFQCSNLLQFGMLVEKDAGEKWFTHGGFDFNSFHLFIRNVGAIKKLSLGDFQVNMGQGLIQWQGIARKKSANVLAINQQSELITPYRSAGEVRFHRGAALVLGGKHLEWMAYVSIRKLSANVEMDSLHNEYVTSISTSGYHRTLAEINDRNTLQQVSTGSSVGWITARGRIRINWAAFQFSHEIQKRDEPYNLFSIRGKQLSNLSVDYAYTLNNVHWFGELATDKEYHLAWLTGMLLTLDRNLDCSVLIRSISRKYSNMYANAFTENSTPNNETGIYSSLSLRLSTSMRVDAYADAFRFPWLKYGIDAGSSGSDFLFQFSWQPNKRTQLNVRWKREMKQQDDGNSIAALQPVLFAQRNNFRVQLSWDFSKKINLTERIETTSFEAGDTNSNGFLLFNECRFHPPFKSIDCWARILFFQTGSYDARIYAFERDVQYGFSIPAYSGKGFHYAFNLHYDLNSALMHRFHLKKKIGVWLNWTQTFLAGNSSLQSGSGEISGKTKSTLRIQIIANS
jgi:hypothetical protein